MAAFVNDEVAVGIKTTLAFFAGRTNFADAYGRLFGDTRGENYRPVNVGTNHAIGLR